MDLESREIAQARTRIDALLNEPLTAELRGAALALGGEAAYAGRAWDEAAARYSRFLAEFPTSPQAPSVMLALGWAEFRRGRLEAARDTWTRFATTNRADPRAPAALLLAAELAARSGDTVGARALLDGLVARYPEGEYADIARLNRSILAIRAGRAAERPRRSHGADPPRAAVSLHGADAARARRGPRDGRQGARRPRASSRARRGRARAPRRTWGSGASPSMRGQWDEAEREFVEARDTGAGAVAAAAEYGIAAVLWNQGKTDDFKRFAQALLARPADPAITPNVLAAAAALAAEEGRWKDARTLAMRAVNEFPTSDAAPAALSLVGAAAARGGEWPLASESFQLLTERYPGYKTGREARLDYAEALYRTGALAEAQARLQEFIDAISLAHGPRVAARLVLLGRTPARDSPGTPSCRARSCCSAAPTRPAATGPRRSTSTSAWSASTPPSRARRSSAMPACSCSPATGTRRGRSSSARWGRGIAAVAAEAAYRLGEGLRGAGRHQQAVESYMTAAYVAPDTPLARRALLGAGQSFTALKQPDSAIIVYKKLLAGKTVEPELADAAKKGLRALGVN